MSGYGTDQGAATTAAAVLRSPLEPGKASPIRGGGCTAKRIRRRERVACMAVLHRAGVSDSVRRVHAAAESTKDGRKLDLATGMLGASLTVARSGKLHLKSQPWSRTGGKPAVRNLSGDDGIRSPVRAIVLPDKLVTS